MSEASRAAFTGRTIFLLLEKAMPTSLDNAIEFLAIIAIEWKNLGRFAIQFSPGSKANTPQTLNGLHKGCFGVGDAMLIMVKLKVMGQKCRHLLGIDMIEAHLKKQAVLFEDYRAQAIDLEV